MDKNRQIIIVLSSIGVIAFFVLMFFVYRALKPQDIGLNLVSQQPEKSESVTKLIGTEVGTGISGNDNPSVAVKEAADMALEGKIQEPDIAIVFVNATAQASTVLAEARNYFGEDVKIFGGTSSSRAVMSDKGIIATEGENFSDEYQQATDGIVVMTISSDQMEFGVSTVEFSDYESAKLATGQAFSEAILSADKTEADKPAVILMTSVRPYEDTVIKSIEDLLGKDTVLLGGTAGGSSPAIFGQEDVYDRAVSLAFIYTDLPVGWTFGNSFDYPDLKSGLVTKAEGMEILEIDNRPALDVLNEWLDGGIDKIYEENKNPRSVQDFLAFYPIYRKQEGDDGQIHFLISHPWPKDPTMVGKSVLTATHIKEGEQIFLGHGSVEQLMNGIANLPREAKKTVGMDMSENPILAFGFVCNGALGVIPEHERMKLPKLVGAETGGAPYIIVFSYGEQGFLPGFGNAHVNLSTSFMVIGSNKK